MPNRTKYELPTHPFKTPEVFKHAEISRIKGQLKAQKRYESIVKRHAKKQLEYESQYQIKLGLELRKLL